ncbi:hypothetical protein LPJ71_010215, partial [Coemansia sp. S17]
SADSMLHVGAVTWIDDTEDQADSSSEDGDEDEDSNSEGYYANDYPDDESVNSRDSYYYSDEEREHIQDGAVDICDMNNTMYQDEDY